MKLELTVYDLGKVLKNLEKNYELELMTKLNLSGGWMTILGKATIENAPQKIVLGCSSKSNNIIDIKVNTGVDGGAIIKLTGAKDKKFSVDISSTRYKEIYNGNINPDEVKVNNEETKVRIDENIIFKIKATKEEVVNLL